MYQPFDEVVAHRPTDGGFNFLVGIAKGEGYVQGLHGSYGRTGICACDADELRWCTAYLLIIAYVLARENRRFATERGSSSGALAVSHVRDWSVDSPVVTTNLFIQKRSTRAAAHLDDEDIRAHVPRTLMFGKRALSFALARSTGRTRDAVRILEASPATRRLFSDRPIGGTHEDDLKM